MMSEEKKRFTLRLSRLILIVIVALILARIFYYFHVAEKPNTNNIWSHEYTDSLYKIIYNKVGVSSSDTLGIRLLTTCVVEKIKAKHPLGINKLPDDTVTKMYIDYSKDCMKNIIIHFYWSEKADSSIRHGIMNSSWINKIPITKQKPLCDCYIEELKKNYPGNLSTQVPKNVKDSLILYCAKRVLAK